MSTAPQPPEQSPEPAAAKFRPWMLPAIMGVGVAAVIGIATVLMLVLSGPEKFSLTGTLAIYGDVTEDGLPDGFECAGAGSMSDIEPHLRVIVADGAHELLGKGELTGSFSGGADTCIFSLVVHDLPRDRQEYLVQMSHRGEASFTPDEATAGIELTINQ